MSFITGTNAELIYTSTALGTAKNTFTTEAQLNDTAGMGVQAHLPPDFWLPSTAYSVGRAIHIRARGILSSTATPTYTFTVRAGAAGSTSAVILLGSTALTTGTTVTNQYWELEGDVVLSAIGAAGANSSIRGFGTIFSGGLASPFEYPVWGGAIANTGLASTLDTSITNYINFNVACSVSSASNSIQLLQLMVWGWN